MQNALAQGGSFISRSSVALLVFGQDPSEESLSILKSWKRSFWDIHRDTFQRVHQAVPVDPFQQIGIAFEGDDPQECKEFKECKMSTEASPGAVYVITGGSAAALREVFGDDVLPLYGSDLFLQCPAPCSNKTYHHHPRPTGPPPASSSSQPVLPASATARADSVMLDMTTPQKAHLAGAAAKRERSPSSSSSSGDGDGDAPEGGEAPSALLPNLPPLTVRALPSLFPSSSGPPPQPPSQPQPRASWPQPVPCPGCGQTMRLNRRTGPDDDKWTPNASQYKRYLRWRIAASKFGRSEGNRLVIVEMDVRAREDALRGESETLLNDMMKSSAQLIRITAEAATENVNPMYTVPVPCSSSQALPQLQAIISTAVPGS